MGSSCKISGSPRNHPSSPIPPPVSIQLNEHTVNAHEVLKGHHARGTGDSTRKGRLADFPWEPWEYQHPLYLPGDKGQCPSPLPELLVLSGGSEGRGLGREKVRSEFRQRQHMSSGRHRDGRLRWAWGHHVASVPLSGRDWSSLKIPLSPGGTKLGAHCGMKRGGTTVGPRVPV